MFPLRWLFTHTRPPAGSHRRRSGTGDIQPREVNQTRRERRQRPGSTGGGGEGRPRRERGAPRSRRSSSPRQGPTNKDAGRGDGAFLLPPPPPLTGSAGPPSLAPRRRPQRRRERGPAARARPARARRCPGGASPAAEAPAPRGPSLRPLPSGGAGSPAAGGLASLRAGPGSARRRRRLHVRGGRRGAG